MRQILLLALGVLASGPHQAAETKDTSLAQPGKDLQRFMQQELNPAFTELSYQLFHAQPEPAEEAVVAAAERVQRLTEQLPQYAEAVGGDLTSFHIHAVQLRITARALATSEASEIKSWFKQLSAVCNSCHDDYKP